MVIFIVKSIISKIHVQEYNIKRIHYGIQRSKGKNAIEVNNTMHNVRRLIVQK